VGAQLVDVVLRHIAEDNGLQVEHLQRLTGGDINEVFLLSCTTRKVVAKCNQSHTYPGMFEAEKKGLSLLASAGAFRVPKVLAIGDKDSNAYLLLEYIESGNMGSTFWQRFAEQLAALHTTTQAHFGLDHDNYIGSLRQYNCPERTLVDFYLNQRLLPQFRMAIDKGYSFPRLDQFYKQLATFLPEEVPALLHGDLWGGNFMVSAQGEPVLIDPAVVYGPREMDIAMMQLFGGFDASVFNNYNELFPMQPRWQDRLQIYQLYYLLVHLNLFGSSYLDRVQHIAKRYT
jgi:fructosamine-3-kinase